MPQETSVVVGLDEDEENPFKATLLWGKIVAHLESSIKCGRHTQSLRSYSNCFQGSKAVDCLFLHLQKVLTKPVKRQQVQILCQKLLLTGVIQDVKGEKGVFREGRLYRLTKNHFWEGPEEGKLARARSAETICTAEKESDVDDLKGYASDSTVGHSGSQDEPRRLSHKKRRSREREPEFHHLKEYKVTSLGVRPPASPGMLRMKSTGSIYRTPVDSPASSICDSRDSLLGDSKPKRKSSRPPKPDRHKTMVLHIRRGSVDGGVSLSNHHHRSKRASSMDTLVQNESIPPNKPLSLMKRARRAGKGKERTFRGRHMSQSLKGERDRPSISQEDSRVGGGSGVLRKKVNRSHSFSSVDDYDQLGAYGGGSSASPEGAVFEDDCIPESPTSPAALSGSKWTVYGFV